MKETGKSHPYPDEAQVEELPDEEPSGG